MTVELERRQDLSPTQAAIERTARGEDPRTAHQVTIGDAIRYEQQLRSVALPQATTTVTRPAATTTVSEDLAPSVLLRDELVPASYRAELDRLRTHLGQRVLVRGAQLAEEKPVWTNALGPVPGKDAKAADWHSIAAETEAYRNRYNISTHETALIPKQYRDDPTAQRLIEHATALHKYSELTTVTPRTATQMQQGADEAAMVDRMTTEQAAARRVIDRMRAERAAASDPLPAAQQREARIVEATQAEPGLQQGDDMSAAIAHVLARHRAETEGAAGVLSSEVKDQNTKEAGVNENKDAARPTNRSSQWGKKTQDAVQRKKVTPGKPTTKSAQEEAASAARKAAEAAGRSRGRSR